MAFKCYLLVSYSRTTKRIGDKGIMGERVKFALELLEENEWINVNEDLPYKHKELLLTESRTINIFTKDEYEDFSVDFMIKINNKWYWNGDYASDYSHWMIISKPPKE